MRVDEAVRARRPSPVAAGEGEGCEWIVDNAAAYERLLSDFAGARESIWISQLAFDADCVAPGGGRTLLGALVAAAARGVEVRILLNETLLLDTATPLRRALARAGASAIAVRGMHRFPQLLHAKLVIVDGREGWLVGSPFVNGYWDDAAHHPVDERRPVRELGGRPLHDLSVRVDGAAALALAGTFAELWNAAPGPGRPLFAPRTAPRALPPDDAAPRVLLTAPAGALPGRPEGSTAILDECLAGIADARELIYVEHQYLSSRRVVAALREALVRRPRLEIVVVLNQNADVTAYRAWQNARLSEAAFLQHPRVGLFALWTADAPSGDAPRAVNQLFVHSKVVIVDDAWALVGSANLDGVSLHSYGDDFASLLGRRVFRDVRNFDVSVALRDGEAVATLRTRLWSEHLGAPTATLRSRGAHGWLARWRAAAAHNVAALGARPGPMRGFVLPYSTCATPRAQLADVGVADAPGALDLRFDPGWLEVHASPNWVRNMFA